MTTSEWVRVALIIGCLGILLARRYDLKGQLQERKQKKERQAAELRRREVRKERRQQ